LSAPARIPLRRIYAAQTVEGNEMRKLTILLAAAVVVTTASAVTTDASAKPMAACWDHSGHYHHHHGWWGHRHYGWWGHDGSFGEAERLNHAELVRLGVAH
jgi:hypothetical protein